MQKFNLIYLKYTFSQRYRKCFLIKQKLEIINFKGCLKEYVYANKKYDESKQCYMIDKKRIVLHFVVWTSVLILKLIFIYFKVQLLPIIEQFWNSRYFLIFFVFNEKLIKNSKDFINMSFYGLHAKYHEKNFSFSLH